ncbi:MAG: T3SS effector HopA1 family protein [Acidobacteriota bacterium]|nr:T3SS effector HopA1 family protein [Acidobacteriota bacterium]
MQPALASELGPVVEAVRFSSDDAFVFAGLPSTPLGPIPPANTQDSGLPPLLAQLQTFLYGYAYCRRFTGVGDQTPPPAVPADGFSAGLSRANSTQERWDAGWQIAHQLPSGQFLAQKHGLYRAVWPGEFMNVEGYGRAPQQGANVSLYFPRESRTLQPGFYFVFGDTPSDQMDDYAVVRFYWHVSAAGAAGLITALTQQINRFQVPFRFKTLDQAQSYFRRDAAVLYVSRRYYRAAAEAVAAIHSAVRPLLGQDAPLFSRQLAPGLGFAEDPGNQESFGMARCRVLAQGIWNAYKSGASTPEQRLGIVLREFETNGVSVERPYLNPGSEDRYPFP